MVEEIDIQSILGPLDSQIVQMGGPSDFTRIWLSKLPSMTVGNDDQSSSNTLSAKITDGFGTIYLQK